MKKYRNEFTIELPPESLPKTRSEFLQSVTETIENVAHIAGRTCNGDTVEFTVEYDMDEVEDLYDLAVIVQSLERELASSLYYGHQLILEKPYEVEC